MLPSTDRLSYALSHDLRARLRATRGFVELARSELTHVEPTGGAAAASLLERAGSAADLADRMTERLVFYLRINPSGDIAPTAASEVMSQALARLHEPPDTTVGDLPEVMADREMLVDAMVEILDNSVRYGPTEERPVVRIEATVDGPWATLTLTDNGQGIEASRIDRAFELFTQVHRVGDTPGSGMGLPIARRLVEAQGGTLSIVALTVKGSAVAVRLPIAT